MNLQGLNSLSLFNSMIGVAGLLLKMSVKTSMASMQVKQALSARSVHNTSKNNHTNLILSTQKHGKFRIMNLGALKYECRNRGLKVSGRKSELLERITAFDAQQFADRSSTIVENIPTKRGFHLISALNNKEVITVKMPKVCKGGDVDSLESGKHTVHAPIVSSESTDASLVQEDSVGTLERGRLTLVAQEGAISTANADLKIQRAAFIPKDTEIFEEGFYSSEESKDTNYKSNSRQNTRSYAEPDKLSSRDKKFFCGVAAGVVMWWYLGTDAESAKS